jgi:hypothetical protein
MLRVDDVVQTIRASKIIRELCLIDIRVLLEETRISDYLSLDSMTIQFSHPKLCDLSM